MSPYEFATVKDANNVEAATHLVFDQAYMKWITQGAKDLTTGELTVYVVETVFGEICNGGIPQYLDNESGQLAEHAPAALRRVGLAAYAVVLSDVLEMFEKSILDGHVDEDDVRYPWIEWNLKNGTSDGAMENLESKFFKLYSADQDEFRMRLFQYIAANEAEFVSNN